MRFILASTQMLAAAPTFAAEPLIPVDNPSENGRYAMTPTDGGFLRLDTRTGMVSLCAVSAGAVACRAGADERKALEDEIARLSGENARLKLAAGQSGSRYGIPNDQDVDRALGLAERFMKRMMRVLRDDQPDKG